MTATRHGAAPLPPATLADFKTRLGVTSEPDQVADLDTRANVAAGIVLKALADGNTDLADRAFTRMAERWEQREALQPAPRQLWEHRYDQALAIFEAAPTGSPIEQTAHWQVYYTADRSAGRVHNLAVGYADRRMENVQGRGSWR